jgi:hypothetical protein
VSSPSFQVWRPGPQQLDVSEPPRAVARVTAIMPPIPRGLTYGQGVAVADEWPADAHAKLDKKGGKALADSVYGAYELVVSTRIRPIFEKLKISRVELLPLRILGANGKLVSKGYLVVNPIEIVDCIDREASGATMIAKTRMDACKRLVLDETKVPRGAIIFRPAYWTTKVIVRRSFADAVDEAGLVGLHFVDPGAYTGLF